MPDQGSPAVGSAVRAQQHFEVPEFRLGLLCVHCALLALGNGGR
jgi:hypothetical protein